MTFVNQYSKPPRLRLRDTGVFLEKDAPFLYAVGQADGPGVVIKTAMDGKAVWARELLIGEQEVQLFGIEQLEASAGPCYVTCAAAGGGLHLLALDAEGEELWLLELATKEAEPAAFLAAGAGRDGVYLAYSDRSNDDGVLRPKLLHFDAQGTLLAARELLVRDFEGEAFALAAIGAHAGGVAVAGNLGAEGGVGCTLSLGADLEAAEASIHPELRVQDLLAHSAERYAATAYSEKHSAVVLLREAVFGRDGKGASGDCLLFPESARRLSALGRRKEGLLVSVLDGARGELYSVADDGELAWQKSLALGDEALAILSLSWQPAVDGVGFVTPRLPLLGLEDSDFESCLVYKESRPALQRLSFDTRLLPLDAKAIRVAIKRIAGRWQPMGPVWEPACEPPTGEPPFQPERDRLLQSHHLYLQAAGSQGGDSTRGIHLRWLLKSALASHLPKDNLGTPFVNFNKPDDYVRIFRAPYVQRLRPVGFQEAPRTIAGYAWAYEGAGELFQLSFLDRARYDQVRLTKDPALDPAGFLAAYGDGLLELEHPTRLAFAVQLVFTALGPSARVDLELRSVEENRPAAPRAVTLRLRSAPAQLSQKKLYSENIRGVRFRGVQALLSRATFELYDDFFDQAAATGAWAFLGRHALTTDDAVAFARLEPTPGDVHGRWLRYNDGAAVNADNYRNKWSSAALPPENRIVETVKKYIDLSDDPANPEAKELVFYNDPAAVPAPGFEPEPDFDPTDNQFELSNLYLLQLASLDYHVARMLGLGVLDLDPAILAGHHVYLAEYVTLADLGDGQGARRLQHLYLSLPTSLAEERLPLPIDLKEPVPGVIFGADTEAPEVLTGPGGYSADGRTRYLSLFPEPLPEEPVNAAFFHSSLQFSSAERTLPVFAGIEYRKTGAPAWVKPELPFDAAWHNVDPTVGSGFRQETRAIVLPEPPFPVFVHRERQSGWHDYGSYGINWFSRATPSAVVRSIETTITASNLLLPPTNLSAHLVQPERPLFLTSESEQATLAGLTGADKTLIRLAWDYNHGQELIDYHREIDGELLAGYAELPDAEELFAEEIEIYFRDSVPNAFGGKVVAVADAANPLLAVVETGEYVFESQGIDPVTGLPASSLLPELPAAPAAFLGSLLVVDGISYPIESIDDSGAFPRLTVFKVDADGNAVDLASSIPPAELSAPPTDGLFTVVENMASPANWGAAGNPLGLRARLEPAAIHREEVEIRQPDGSIDTHVHKFRGVLRNALIAPEPEGTPPVHLGLYKITFTGFAMPQHSQAGGSGHRVEFSGGVVRIRSAGSPAGPRRELKVLRTENIGAAADLVLYAVDAGFDAGDPAYDAIETGVRSVSWYPSYRAYLVADPAHRLTAGHTLPGGDEAVRYTVFGARSHDAALGYFSRMSVPALMFARALREPLRPRLPTGGVYASRPDFYGKATFTFGTVFEHAPHGVQYLRASDVQILRALYTPDDGGNPATWTAKRVQEEIFENGAEPFFNDRWKNLVGLDYVYPADPGNDGRFEQLGGRALPLPNNPRFFAAVNAFVDSHNAFYGTSVPHLAAVSSLHQVVIPASAQNAQLRVADFLRETVQNCFLPLTEVPILFQHIKGSGYQPIPKKQVVRNRDGELLPPGHPDFDMAPMAKRPGAGNATEFTDFNLDGAANAHYFYAVREFSIAMQAGPFSPILGPVHLVNAAPPRPPEVVKVTPILEQRDPAVPPAIEVRINAYPAVQRIKTIELHRASSGLEARSVRTMQKVAEVDLAAAGMTGDDVWLIRDDFSDLGHVPYGDPLFYVVTVSREIEYHDRNGVLVADLVPSEPSKTVLTNIVENYPPEPPQLEYYSQPPNAEGELEQVTLAWPKTVHNGKYHLQKRNAQGNWTEILLVETNAERIVVALASISVGGGTLPIEDEDGNPVRHHFKVVAENFAGLASRKEEILTIHQPAVWQDISTL